MTAHIMESASQQTAARRGKMLLDSMACRCLLVLSLWRPYRKKRLTKSTRTRKRLLKKKQKRRKTPPTPPHKRPLTRREKPTPPHKRPPKRKALAAIVSRERQTLPGPHFRAAAPGDTFDFLHPRSGVRHTLTVQSCQRQELPESCFRHMPDRESPAHCLVMTYTVTPELPEGALTVCDCAENDPPREKAGSSPSSAEGSGAAAVIGGADGPTVVLFSAGGERSGVHTACSALHFQPVQDVEWRMVFHEKAEADMTVELL